MLCITITRAQCCSLTPSDQRPANAGRELPAQGYQQVKPIYFTTPLPISECRLRLAERVGKPRWRWTFSGLGRYCDKPLQGSVTPDGFDVAETGPRGHGAEDAPVRGRWAEAGPVTVMRVQPYVTWGFWAGLVFGGIFCGGALTLVALAIAGGMTDSQIGACLLGFSATCTVALLWAHSRRLSSLGREFARRLAVLLEAEPVEESEAPQLDMHFGD